MMQHYVKISLILNKTHFETLYVIFVSRCVRESSKTRGSQCHARHWSRRQVAWTAYGCCFFLGVIVVFLFTFFSSSQNFEQIMTYIYLVWMTKKIKLLLKVCDWHLIKKHFFVSHLKPAIITEKTTTLFSWASHKRKFHFQ